MPADSRSGVVCLPTQEPLRPKEKVFRIRSRGVLLTYQKFSDTNVWPRFLTYVESVVQSHRVRYWSATMETNGDGTFHLHLMLQFKRDVDTSTKSFAFEGVTPNGQPNDLLGEGWGGRNYQRSLDRSFFYVWAAKRARHWTLTGASVSLGTTSRHGHMARAPTR